MDHPMVKVKVNGNQIDLRYGREIGYSQAIRLARLVDKKGLIARDFRVRFRYKTGRYGMLYYMGPKVTAAQGLVITISRS